MAQRFSGLEPKHFDFIARQHVFFTASAAPTGHVNVSPRSTDMLRILGPNRAMYLDRTGSGNETAAHLLANGRLTIMLCAFDGPPLIMRLYGHGRPVLPQDSDWGEYAAPFDLLPGTRQIFVIHVDQVQTSCGWGVPHMSFERERDTLSKYHRQYGEDVRQAKYAVRLKSIDGLPVRNPTMGPPPNHQQQEQQQQ